METITLSYNDYMTLLEGYTKYKSIELDLEYMLNTSQYDRYDKDVNVNGEEFRILFKKYIKDRYDLKLAELEQEYEEKNKKENE